MCPRRWFYTQPPGGVEFERTLCRAHIFGSSRPAEAGTFIMARALGDEACSERWAGLGPQRDCVILGRGLPGVLLMSDRLELQAECACVAIGVAQLAPGRQAGQQSGKRRSGTYSGRTRQTPATPPRDPTARGSKPPRRIEGPPGNQGPNFVMTVLWEYLPFG